jgi:hypothetical protein
VVEVAVVEINAVLFQVEAVLVLLELLIKMQLMELPTLAEEVAVEHTKVLLDQQQMADQVL